MVQMKVQKKAHKEFNEILKKGLARYAKVNIKSPVKRINIEKTEMRTFIALKYLKYQFDTKVKPNFKNIGKDFLKSSLGSQLSYVVGFLNKEKYSFDDLYDDTYDHKEQKNKVNYFKEYNTRGMEGVRDFIFDNITLFNSLQVKKDKKGKYYF